MQISYDATAKVFHLSNQHISYIMQVDRFGVVAHIYFGPQVSTYSNYHGYPLQHRDFEVELVAQGEFVRDWYLGTLLQEYPNANHGDFRHPAMLLRFEDGSTVTDFRYQRHEIVDETAVLPGLPQTYATAQEPAKTLKLYLYDQVQELELVLHYTLFDDYPIVVRSAVLTNQGQATVNIEKFASFSLDLSARKADVIQLNGTWATERTMERETVHKGIKTFDSKRGTSSHQQTPFMALVAPETGEFHGEAIGIQLVYSGSHEMSVERDPYNQIRLQAGIQSLGFNWRLAPETSFETPEVLLCYSDQGLNKMSQAFHHFLRNHLVPAHFAKRERPILINNWEGTYFDFTEAKLHALIDQAAELGIELFVLDDGWFGKRDLDNSSLGDWFEYQAKLPNGLAGLAEYAHQKGLQFGLWFEPEMISQDSELYRAHPDYPLGTPNRERSFGRNQYVLDMSRQDVRDNIFDQMTKILDRVPIDYVKWDMNRHLSEVYSLGLPAERQGEVAHRYVLGVYELMERITTRYPQILFESCSGGGGRFDLGIMAYMPQTWTSDNSDAIARLKIQYGTSLMAPINTMGAHVSAVPNHQTHRVTPLATRAIVAYAGDFGYELDLTQMTAAELAEVREQVDFYKKHRQLLQLGEFTRLLSPYEGQLTAWMFHQPDLSEALVMVIQVLGEAAPPLQVIKVPHLAANSVYRVTSEGLDFTATGRELAHVGFYLFPALQGDYQARVYHIQQV